MTGCCAACATRPGRPGAYPLMRSVVGRSLRRWTPIARPGFRACRLVTGHVAPGPCDQFRSFSSTPGGTTLGAYLERCGANWGDAYDVEPVQQDAESRRFTWRIEMPPQRLAGLRPGDMLESPTFPLPGGCRGRFQLFPLGDSVDQVGEGLCSLYLCADAPVLENFQLRLGRVTRGNGASEFCRLEEALADGFMDISLELEAHQVASSAPKVEQSLFIEELQRAEWQLFQASSLKNAKLVQPISSPPFRFHHVLLGDMYLELLPGVPHPEHCVMMFRCRVPTMQLQVTLSVGTSFSKTIVALGKSTMEEDLKQGSFLQVNLEAPGVLAEDGSLTVHCKLDQVLAIPRSLRELIPKLDERANWPKRI